MRILVVEDDKKIASFIAKGLKEAGYAVDISGDGLDGLEMGSSGVYDAAIVDIMLPGIDGLTLIERLRAQKINTPVIILSAKRTVDDRVKGLQTGGGRLSDKTIFLFRTSGSGSGTDPKRYTNY